MKRYILITLTLLTLVACSLPTRAPVAPSAWMITPERTGAPYKPRTDYWLKIGAVSVAPPFDGRSLVYRLGDQRYEKDFYNVYSTIPAESRTNNSECWQKLTKKFEYIIKNTAQ